jgi:hypothetical protein
MIWTALLTIFIGALFIVLSEPLARGTLALYGRMFRLPVRERDVDRSKRVFLASGTVLLVCNSLLLYRAIGSH